MENREKIMKNRGKIKFKGSVVSIVPQASTMRVYTTTTVSGLKLAISVSGLQLLGDAWGVEKFASVKGECERRWQ